MSNLVKFGLSNVHVAFEGESAFEAPIAIPGAVNVALDVAGDEAEFYADNSKYWVFFKNNGYTGTLETALFPDDVLARALGWYTDANGNIVEDADGKQESFALGFQIDGDANNRGTWFYSCKLSRPSVNGATTDSSITPQTDTVNLTITPKRFDNINKKVVKIVCPDLSNDTDFLDAVVLPSGAAVATFSAVTPAGTENPYNEGWYTKVSTSPDVYALTDDTEVDNEQTYYEKD